VRVPGIAGRAGRGRLLGRGDGPHPVHRAGQGELRRAEPLDEVPAPALPGLLHGPQHRVQRAEPSRHAFGHHRAAGHDTVPVEQCLGDGM
jgi:hypothetical protein